MKNQSRNSPAFLRALAEIANEPDGEVTTKKPKTKAEALARMIWDTALGKVREGRGPLNVPVKVRDKGDFKAAVALVKQLLDCPDSAAGAESSHPPNQPPASNRESAERADQLVPNRAGPKPEAADFICIYALLYIPGKDAPTRKKVRDSLWDASRKIVAGSSDDTRIPKHMRIIRKRARGLYILWVQANCLEVTEAEAAAEFDRGSDTTEVTWEWLVTEPKNHNPAWQYEAHDGGGVGFYTGPPYIVTGLEHYWDDGGDNWEKFLVTLDSIVDET